MSVWLLATTVAPMLVLPIRHSCGFTVVAVELDDPFIYRLVRRTLNASSMGSVWRLYQRALRRKRLQGEKYVRGHEGWPNYNCFVVADLLIGAVGLYYTYRTYNCNRSEAPAEIE